MRALLYRLAASLQPVAREHLCFLLWPDTPEATARRYLTVLLNLLRQVLPTPGLLLAHRDAVSLDPVAVEVDTVAFAQALATASTQRSIVYLSEAVALYTGPFLAGFSMPASPEFDAWADLERQSWERRYLDALAMLVDGFAAQGDYGHAIEAAQRALAWLELGEGYHFTTASSVRAVEHVLRDRPSGALAPAQAFGADFVLTIEGVRRWPTSPLAHTVQENRR